MKRILFIVILLYTIPICKADKWTRKGDFPGEKRTYPYFFVIDDKAYVGGGYYGGNLADFWEYDASTDHWTEKTKPPFPLTYAPVGFAIGDRGYVFINSLNEFWEYNPKTDSWVRKADLPGPEKKFPTLFVIGGKGYIAGGLLGNNFFYHSLHCYDPAKNTWSQLADVSWEIGAANYFIQNEKVYITGIIATAYCSRLLLEYDPVLDKWARKADFPGTPRSQGSTFTIGNKGYFGLGEDGQQGFKDWWQYDQQNNSWLYKSSIPCAIPKDENPSFVINHKGYVGFGLDGLPNNEVWEYTPDSVAGVAVCAGSELNLNISRLPGNWSSSNTAIATVDAHTGMVKAKIPGDVVITFSDNTFSETFFVTVQGVPTITASVKDVTCYGAADGTITASAGGSNGPFTYAWSTTDSLPVINALLPGEYVIKVTDSATRCVTADTFMIRQPDTLHITSLTVNDTCEAGKGSITVQVSGGTGQYAYRWSNTDTTDAITNLSKGSYTLVVTDANMCSTDKTYTITDTCNAMIVHDVITPNGDGINDHWVIEGIKDYPQSVVQVFDKRGDMVYEQHAYKNEWEGQASTGAALPDGTYFYVVKLNAPNRAGGSNVFTGSVIIKR